MIRFIDLKANGVPGFAFYNTVNDRFVEIDGNVTWDSLEDFRVDCAVVEMSQETRNRYHRLIPDGYDDLELWYNDPEWTGKPRPPIRKDGVEDADDSIGCL